jgi:hypothetical protein
VEELEVDEVVEVSVLFPPYSMTDRFPEILPPGQENYGWIRAKVEKVFDNSKLVWLVFGKKLTMGDLPPGCSHHYVGIYNAIVHRNMVRRLSVLDRMAAET